MGGPRPPQPPRLRGPCVTSINLILSLSLLNLSLASFVGGFAISLRTFSLTLFTKKRKHRDRNSGRGSYASVGGYSFIYSETWFWWRSNYSSSSEGALENWIVSGSQGKRQMVEKENSWKREYELKYRYRKILLKEGWDDLLERIECWEGTFYYLVVWQTFSVWIWSWTVLCLMRHSNFKTTREMAQNIITQIHHRMKDGHH